MDCVLGFSKQKLDTLSRAHKVDEELGLTVHSYCLRECLSREKISKSAGHGLCYIG